MSNNLDQIYEHYETIQNKYENILDSYNDNIENLKSIRKKSSKLIKDIENLVNSIANTPKEFDNRIQDIHANAKSYVPVSDLIMQHQKKEKLAHIGLGFFAIVGIVIAFFIGKKDDDNEQSSYNFILIILAVILVFLFYWLLKYIIKKIEIKKIQALETELHSEISILAKENTKITNLYEECTQLFKQANQLFESQKDNRNTNYIHLSLENQYTLGTLVNATNSLSQYLTKKP